MYNFHLTLEMHVPHLQMITLQVLGLPMFKDYQEMVHAMFRPPNMESIS